MKLQTRIFELPVRHPFTIARGTTHVQRTLIVELRQDGEAGYGEAPEVDYFERPAEQIEAAVRGLEEELASRSLEDIDAMGAWLRERLPRGAGPESLLARCALDCAAWDLWGKLQGQPVWRLWGLDTSKAVASDYTIGIDEPEVMAEKLREMPGWPAYKVKLGTPRDLEIVRRLREETDVPLYVDANCAWSADEAIDKVPQLEQLGVAIIEQPLPPERWDDMARVFQALKDRSPRLIADESCKALADVDRCATCFHGVNLKLAKCGGLTGARRIVARARELGLNVMAGCFTESSVSISAAAQLMPMLDWADLDGAALLAEDVAEGVRIDRGRAIFPATPGCGIRMTR